MKRATRAELLGLVQASVAAAGGVQAAVVGIAVSDQFESVFDTLLTTRKAQNLLLDPHIALVIGGLLDGREWRTARRERSWNG